MCFKSDKQRNQEIHVFSFSNLMINGKKMQIKTVKRTERVQGSILFYLYSAKSQ